MSVTVRVVVPAASSEGSPPVGGPVAVLSPQPATMQHVKAMTKISKIDFFICSVPPFLDLVHGDKGNPRPLKKPGTLSF